VAFIPAAPPFASDAVALLTFSAMIDHADWRAGTRFLFGGRPADESSKKAVSTSISSASSAS